MSEKKLANDAQKTNPKPKPNRQILTLQTTTYFASNLDPLMTQPSDTDDICLVMFERGAKVTCDPSTAFYDLVPIFPDDLPSSSTGMPKAKLSEYDQLHLAVEASKIISEHLQSNSNQVQN